MAYGLPRKIRKAFIVQALLASLAVLLGGYLMALVVKYGLINAVLQGEAEYYWQQSAQSADPAPPNTLRIRGYLQPAGQSDAMIPEPLRRLPPGFHELEASDQLVLVDQQAAGRLYLVFQRSPARRGLGGGAADTAGHPCGVMVDLPLLITACVADKLAGTQGVPVGPASSRCQRAGARTVATGSAG